MCRLVHPSGLLRQATTDFSSIRLACARAGSLGKMAEESLYGNVNEPKFPFDRIAEHLSWLPSRMSALENSIAEKSKSSEFVALLQTVLVFCRGRTAGLEHMMSWNACHELALSLNTALERAGAEALYHRIELVRRGPNQFFVTCTNSPRFNWKARLTHLEVGRNLDYFAAGHMFLPPWPPIHASITFYERKTMHQFLYEKVSLESLEDDVFLETLRRFNDSKQDLFNNIMERTGLPYRFKWVFNTPHERQAIVTVLKESNPPTAE